MLSDKEAKSLINLYNKWWSKFSENIPVDYIPKVDSHKKDKEKEETFGEALKVLWKHPPDPGDPFKKVISKFKDYEYFLECYHDFAYIYKNIQRLCPKAPLFFETDAFLDYLFHSKQVTKKFIKLNQEN